MNTKVHVINHIDDAYNLIIQAPQQLNNAAKAPAQDWGQTIKLICKIICITVVFIMVVAADFATIMYRAGYAFGQWIHQLNDALTQRIVSKSTQSTQGIDPWQLQLPLPSLIGSTKWMETMIKPLLLPKTSESAGAEWLASTSHATRTTSSSKTTNQRLLPGTKPTCGTEDQRKVVGTTSRAGQSNKSASSPGSKQSAKRSGSTKKPCKTQDKSVTTLDGTTSPSTTGRSGRSRTQRSSPTTVK